MTSRLNGMHDLDLDIDTFTRAHMLVVYYMKSFHFASFFKDLSHICVAVESANC